MAVNNEEIQKQKDDFAKSVADQKQGKPQGDNQNKGKQSKGKQKQKGMFRDKRLNTIVNKIGLTEQDANWCIALHKKYCIWIANQLKVNPDLKRRQGDIDMILDWKKEEQELNLNVFTFEEALAESRIAHGMNFKENNNSLKNKNIVLDLGTYKWVQLLTSEDCREEGNSMGHCIGGGGHASSIQSGKTIAFSLRDEFNKPHLTLEADLSGRRGSGNVFEFKGRNNATPKAEYIECYIELSRKYAEQLGLVTDYTFTDSISRDIMLAQRINQANKRTFSKEDKAKLGLTMFEKGETFMTSVNIGTALKKFVLPEEIKIYGSLIVAIQGKVDIPKGILVGGNVSITSNELKLGNDIQVGGNFDAIGCNKLRVIPSNLQVCGDVLLNESLKGREKEIREKIIFGGRLIFTTESDEKKKLKRQLEENS